MIGVSLQKHLLRQQGGHSLKRLYSVYASYMYVGLNIVAMFTESYINILAQRRSDMRVYFILASYPGSWWGGKREPGYEAKFIYAYIRYECVKFQS